MHNKKKAATGSTNTGSGNKKSHYAKILPHDGEKVKREDHVMVYGYLTAQLARDRDEGPDRLLPFGAGQCAVCGQELPEDELAVINGADVCLECLADYCLSHCAELEPVYACAQVRAGDFAAYFWRQLGGMDRAKLVRAALLGGSGVAPALCREIAHAYCALHPWDFASFCLDVT